MAIYHLSVKVIGRSRGQSAIAAAAYRSGERLTDEAAGQEKHYPARAERIRFIGIFAPPGAPSWVYDRNRLWNEAEQAEKRKDATLAREIVLALPHELTDEQRRWLVSDFVREAFTRRGLVADVAIHAPDRDSDSRNFHAHILITERTLVIGNRASHNMLYEKAPPDGGSFPSNMLLGKGANAPVASPFAETKDRILYSKATLKAWRAQWSNLCNRHLARHHHAARIDHRTLAAQGVDREPTRHLGRVAAQRMRRGASSVRGDGLRATKVRNALRAVTGAAREIVGLDSADVRRGADPTGIHAVASAAAFSMFNSPTKESHDYSTGKIVDDFLALCHDPLHDLSRGGDAGMQPLRVAELGSLLIDDATFERAAREIGGAGRAGLTPELREADACDERPREPCSYEAEVMAITARFTTAIEAVRESGKSRFEIEAMIRALREQQRAELHAVRERRLQRRGSPGTVRRGTISQSELSA